ncbi:hypothetical protein [Couchioplanes azureus]|uniref:hypothetical protein n=1 Tax=Couchioplanes caeruleus TaxID=56438 RepID=UPI0016717E11|nr:hypothetical protein [Couchioplanes caeruleus]GGQ82794.1 hypothetical protein GCM10010166_61210 [Couchioplanes caeruleus subsp. azureus]
MGSRRNHRRTGAVSVLSAFMIGAVLALPACGAGEGDPSTLPSPRASERSVDRPASQEPEADPTAARPSRTDGTQAPRSRQPAPTAEPAEPTKPAKPATPTAPETEPARTTTTVRTTTPAQATTRPPASATVAAPVPAQTTVTTAPAQAGSAPSVSASAAAAAAATGFGPLGWFLLLVLLAALVVGGLMVYRAQRKSAWDAEARALALDTRTVTGRRLPPVLTATTAAQRGLVWLPVRADLTELAGRWNALVERATGEPRRNWSLEIGALLRDLVAAVDAENEALTLGRDWMLLRPRVDQVERALAAALAVQPHPEPPAAGEPRPSAFGT